MMKNCTDGPVLLVIASLSFLIIFNIGEGIFALPVDFNFGASGDWGLGSDAINTAKNMKNHGVELVLGLGDYAYNEGGTAVNTWWNNVKTGLGNNPKWIGALGNHDVNDQTAYLNKFNQNKWWFSYDYQNTHFLALNPYGENYGVNSDQYNFVKNDLAKAASNPNIKWILVFLHPPMYTSPSAHTPVTGLRDTYHKLFVSYKVDLVLEGHNHNYQRTYPLLYNDADPFNPKLSSNYTKSYFDPRGTIFVITGKGGVGTHPLNGKSYYTVKQFPDPFGYLNIDVGKNPEGYPTLTGSFIANDGTIKDQFSIRKNP